MPMFIDNQSGKDNLTISDVLLHQIAEHILADFHLENALFTLCLRKPAEIKKLNKTYRAIDKVTDVLSFSSDGEVDPESGKPYLGDIVICLQQAEEQARCSGHILDNEIALLLVHGLLHLLGFDHGSKEDRQRMWDVQERYLRSHNIILGRIPGDHFDF